MIPIFFFHHTGTGPVISENIGDLTKSIDRVNDRLFAFISESHSSASVLSLLSNLISSPINIPQQVSSIIESPIPTIIINPQEIQIPSTLQLGSSVIEIKVTPLV